MNISILRRDFCLSLVKSIFGDASSNLISLIIDYGPCSLHFLAARSPISDSDIRAILLSLYMHGVVVIERNNISFSPFPLFILSSPSILLNEIRNVYSKHIQTDSTQKIDGVILEKVLNVILHEGVIHISCIGRYIDENVLGDYDIDFIVKFLFDEGFLSNSLSNYQSFNSMNVRNLQRRKENETASKRGKSETKSYFRETHEKVAKYNPDYKVFCINWNHVVKFIRARFIYNFIKSCMRNNEKFTLKCEDLAWFLITKNCGNSCDYVPYRNFRGLSPDDPALKEFENIQHFFDLKQAQRNFEDIDYTEFYDVFEILQCPFLGLFTHDNLITAPECIKNIQIAYIQSHIENRNVAFNPGQHNSSRRTNLLKGRIFSALRELKYADTQKIESEALVSDVHAKSTLYNLYKHGFAHAAIISEDKKRNIEDMRWVYDEEAVITEYSELTAKTAWCIWDLVQSKLEKLDSFKDDIDSILVQEKRRIRSILEFYQSRYSELIKTHILFTEM